MAPSIWENPSHEPRPLHLSSVPTWRIKRKGKRERERRRGMCDIHSLPPRGGRGVSESTCSYTLGIHSELQQWGTVHRCTVPGWPIQTARQYSRRPYRISSLFRKPPWVHFLATLPAFLAYRISFHTSPKLFFQKIKNFIRWGCSSGYSRLRTLMWFPKVVILKRRLIIM